MADQDGESGGEVNIVNTWTANQRAFLDWLSLPTRERLPLTQKMLADELGVREETLCRWKQLPGFEDERLRRIRARLGVKAHEIMGAFVDEASKGSYPHQKTWLEMMGWYTSKEDTDKHEIVIKIVHADGPTNP